MQKPQRPRKRDDELGPHHHDWKDWEKSHNPMTGLSYNKLFDVYQRNENVRVRKSSEIQSIQEEVEKMEKMNKKQIEGLREDYKVMMAYAYVYRLHSMVGQNPDNDDIPLIRKRLKVKPAQHKPKDPDIQALPDNILEYYGEKPESVRLPSIAPKWRPVSFSGNPFEDNTTPGYQEPWINDPYPTLKTDDIINFKNEHDKVKGEDEQQNGHETLITLPAIGTFALKLSNWKNFGKQKENFSNAKKYTRNAMSEPPSRWRGREPQAKLPNLNRPKSYVPDAEFSCKTAKTSKKFYDDEAKKALTKLSSTHKRLQESQKILKTISNPLCNVIDSKKTTSSILKEYRKKQSEVKKGPIKVSHNVEIVKNPKPPLNQNWVAGNYE